MNSNHKPLEECCAQLRFELDKKLILKNVDCDVIDNISDFKDNKNRNDSNKVRFCK